MKNMDYEKAWMNKCRMEEKHGFMTGRMDENIDERVDV